MSKNFIQKYYDIIKTPQNHFYTMGKYISDDMFVSMMASRSIIAERCRCLVYHFSSTSARPCCLPVSTLAQSHACNSVPIRQSAVVMHQSTVQSHSSSQSCTDLQQRWQPTSWLKTCYKYVLYFIPDLDRQIYLKIFLCTWIACLSTNRWKENSTKSKNLKFKWKSIFTENNANMWDKAGAMKVSRKITTTP